MISVHCFLKNNKAKEVRKSVATFSLSINSNELGGSRPRRQIHFKEDFHKGDF